MRLLLVECDFLQIRGEVDVVCALTRHVRCLGLPCLGVAIWLLVFQDM